MARVGAILFFTLFGLTLAIHGRRTNEDSGSSEKGNPVEENVVVYGKRQQGDELLYKKTMPVKVFFMAMYENLDINYPKSKSKNNVEKITKIILSNKSNNNQSWSSKIRNGGIGKNYVDIRVKSIVDMDISIEIYGNRLGQY